MLWPRTVKGDESHAQDEPTWCVTTLPPALRGKPSPPGRHGHGGYAKGEAGALGPPWGLQQRNPRVHTLVPAPTGGQRPKCLSQLPGEHNGDADTGQEQGAGC